jgi:hypothetical protein
VAIYARLDEAEVARGVLESDGIPAALLDAQVAALGLGPAVGGVRVLVPARDEARAVELLAPPPVGLLDGYLLTPAPMPGTLSTVSVTPAPFAHADPPPAPPTAGPLALRVAVWAALVLGLLTLFALRRP